MSDIPIDGRATPNHGCGHPRRQRSDKHPLGTCPRVGDQATQPEGFEMNIENLDRAIDEVFDTVSVPPGVGEGVMRRENWYR